MKVSLCLYIFFMANTLFFFFLADLSHIYLSFLDIIEDMKEECQKYGTVVSLLIPKENPGKGQVGKNHGLKVNIN